MSRMSVQDYFKALPALPGETDNQDSKNDFIDGMDMPDVNWQTPNNAFNKKVEEFAEEPIIIVEDENSKKDEEDDKYFFNYEENAQSSNNNNNNNGNNNDSMHMIKPGIDESNLVWEADKQTGEKTLVKAGSLEKLIERASHPEFVDNLFITDLLFTYRSFTSPEEFLKKLIERFNEEWPEEIQTKLRLRVVNLLKNWIANNSNDFSENPALTRAAKEFAGVIGSQVSAAAGQGIVSKLTKRRVGNDRTRTLIFSKPPPKPLCPTHRGRGPDGRVQRFHYSEAPLLEVARQLTLIEHDLYRSIQPWEFFKCGWSKPDKDQNSPNIIAMVARFNQTSQWVAHEILLGADPHARAKRITTFIELATLCEELNNFNGVMEILAGIDNSAIHRLKHTWPLVKDKHLRTKADLKELMSSSGAYKNPREALHSCKPPCVPYLGMYLTDITFIEDGNKDELKHGNNSLINFNKCRQLATVIREIQLYQNTPYCLAPVTYMQLCFMTEKPPGNEELYQLSLKVEPRDCVYGEDELPPHPCPTDDNGRSLNDPEAQQHDDGASSGLGALGSMVSKGFSGLLKSKKRDGKSSTVRASKTRISSSTLDTNESPVKLRVRVPGVRTRVEVELPGDKTVADVIDEALKHMPEVHLSALKRYAPFRLCLTSDDNGKLQKTLSGSGGLVLADSRQVNSVPPEAYLWLSPLPSSVRVCASLREAANAGHALLSAGTPLSYIALMFRRTNASLLPSGEDVCFLLLKNEFDQSPVWLRSSRSIKGHGLVSEADNTGLHHIDGILVVISTANLGGQISARDAMARSTLYSSMSVGKSTTDHLPRFVVLVEFLILVYTGQNDSIPVQVLAFDHFTLGSDNTSHIVLKRRDGGAPIYLFPGGDIQRWTSRLSKLETTMTMPCGLFGSADTVQPMPSPYRQDSTDRSSNTPNRPPLPISPRSRQSPQNDARASQMRRANSIAAGVMARQQHNKSPGERAPPPKPSSRPNPVFTNGSEPPAASQRSQYGIPRKYSPQQDMDSFGNDNAAELARGVEEQNARAKELRRSLSQDQYLRDEAQVRRERLREAERKRQALQKQEAELQQREERLRRESQSLRTGGPITKRAAPRQAAQPPPRHGPPPPSAFSSPQRTAPRSSRRPGDDDGPAKPLPQRNRTLPVKSRLPPLPSEALNNGPKFCVECGERRVNATAVFCAACGHKY